MQEHQKWEGKRKNFKIRDVVLVNQNNVSRNHWPMARIIDVNSNKKGLVRSVLVSMEKRPENEKSKHELERLIDKIKLILGSDEARFPTKKTMC